MVHAFSQLKRVLGERDLHHVTKRLRIRAVRFTVVERRLLKRV